MAYVIDKGVPLPSKKGCISEVVSNMRPGDSVGGLTFGQSSCFREVIRRYGFLATVKKEESGHYRIWMVKKLPTKKNNK